MATKDPIARTSLHTEVTARLRSLIVESHIKPGERVPELEISKDLGVSRTPIREALKVLASEGLVDLLPLRGAVVKTFSDKDASDMLEVMGLLENFAAQKACQADQKKIDKVLAMHEKMKAMFAKGKRPEYFDLNQKIHDALVEMSGNKSLMMVHTLFHTNKFHLVLCLNTLKKMVNIGLRIYTLLILKCGKEKIYMVMICLLMKVKIVFQCLNPILIQKNLIAHF